MNQATPTTIVPSLIGEGSIWLAFGALAGLAYLPVAADGATAAAVPRFGSQGMMIMCLLYLHERVLAASGLAERLRRVPFAAAWTVGSVLSTAVIVSALGLGEWVFSGRHETAHAEGSVVRDVVHSLGVAALFPFLLLVRDVIGGRVLPTILTGRYHRPLDERRIFLVLDPAGSTGFAESPGGHGAHRLLSRFFADVARVTIRFGGETHASVGDRVIVTRPMAEDGAADARRVACACTLLDGMDRRRSSYEAAFGFVPGFRIALHGGEVVAGECESDRRRIVCYGDAINTAVRLQEIGKALGRDVLVSAALLDRVALPSRCRAVDPGTHAVRGRSAAVRVLAPDRVRSRSTDAEVSRNRAPRGAMPTIGVVS